MWDMKILQLGDSALPARFSGGVLIVVRELIPPTGRQMNSITTVFTARKIITMNPSNPEATAVAVRDGRILGVGSLEDLRGWKPNELDPSFRNKVIVPGFIETHVNRRQASLWSFRYVGSQECTAPDSTLTRGLHSAAEILGSLRDAESQLDNPEKPLIAWGFDPMNLDGQPLRSENLDTISPSRPILVLHSSGMSATVNSAALTKLGGTICTSAGDVRLNEAIHGADALTLADKVLNQFEAVDLTQSLSNLAEQARRFGITTIGDFSPGLSSRELLCAWQKRNQQKGDIRVVVYSSPQLPVTNDAGPIIEDYSAALDLNQPDARIAAVYLLLDGEIQDFDAVLRWPGYLNDKNGQWLVDPSNFREILLQLHRRGISLHAHCEGDGAVDVFLSAVGDAFRQSPWVDHRHTIDHFHLATTDQCRALQKLGVCTNIYIGDLWSRGDQHHDVILGPERARRMSSCATAKRVGLHFSIHSDPFATCQGPLHAMWCAVNRITADGRVLGGEEAISIQDALYACTADAAYQLHMDNEIGSIEVGKWADFAVLDDDPLTSDPKDLRSIAVCATVVAGQIFATAPQPDRIRNQTLHNSVKPFS
jgi:predicted amidohydrolase YtcJ